MNDMIFSWINHLIFSRMNHMIFSWMNHMILSWINHMILSWMKMKDKILSWMKHIILINQLVNILSHVYCVTIIHKILIRSYTNFYYHQKTSNPTDDEKVRHNKNGFLLVHCRNNGVMYADININLMNQIHISVIS